MLSHLNRRFGMFEHEFQTFDLVIGNDGRGILSGIRYQLIYDRLFDRIMDNSKVLEVTGMKQSELTTLYDGLKRELAGVDADTFVEMKNSPIMDQYLKERGL